ncbi:exonuclease domain-containing protein [Sphingobium yanoikuyae]|uniref:exonuclease domain-containing protein n=1 Tax=Sphingobium yanoikuyae TaxID=13690 RepID=UPI0022DD86B7|nr:exonuclease domain-containing protein [Sphingobium yanoikuyae]WBQ19236.1 exonuclease domain-containing protein [Sphingobium yanoikuyae]
MRIEDCPGALCNSISAAYCHDMFQPLRANHSANAAANARSGDTEEPEFVVLDVETACSRVSSICQIGIVGFRNGAVTFEYETLVDPQDHFSSFNTRIHGIAASHVLGQPCFTDIYDILQAHLNGRTTVAHSYFDKGALAAACRIHDRAMLQTTWLDSVRVAKRAWPELPSHRLNVVAKHLGIPLNHHDALSDARAAGMIVVKAIDHTGLQLSDWLAPQPRKRASAPPPPAADGTLKGQRIAILGESLNGSLAQLIAANGGRIMASVGATTTMLVVAADEPFGYVRYDAAFKKAEARRLSGADIQIVSATALLKTLSDRRDV